VPRLRPHPQVGARNVNRREWLRQVYIDPDLARFRLPKEVTTERNRANKRAYMRAYYQRKKKERGT
jgi:hypothetical protein